MRRPWLRAQLRPSHSSLSVSSPASESASTDPSCALRWTAPRVSSPSRRPGELSELAMNRWSERAALFTCVDSDSTPKPNAVSLYVTLLASPQTQDYMSQQD